MKPRKEAPPAQYPPDWTVEDRFQVNGRWLAPGTEVSVKGQRGRFRFIKSVTKPDGTGWLDFVGGAGEHRMMRSFRPDQVKTVHRIVTLRPAS